MVKEILMSVIVIVVSGCTSVPSKKEFYSDEPSAFYYATKVDIVDRDGFQILKLKKGDLDSDEELFVLYSDVIPDTLLNNRKITKIKVPVTSLVSNSTTHLSLLESLSSIQLLTGFAQTQFISSEAIRDKVEKGEVMEIGHNSSLNIEAVASLKPDLILTSGLQNGIGNSEILNSLGIKVLGVTDYAENSLLGKAEWIKVFGSLIGKKSEAETLFSKISIRYDSLRSLTKEKVSSRTVFSGTIYGGSWFMPGGGNYNSTVIQEAGGDYLWKSDESTGWLNLDFEVVYEKAHDAELWIGASNYTSLTEMKNVEERYGNFKAFKTKNIYTYTARVNEYGANDYFESGNINPDRILADHIKIIQPDLLPDYELYYYIRLDD